MVHCDRFESPMGPIWLAGENGVLKALRFVPMEGEKAEPGEFDAVKVWLEAYFRGEQVEPDFPMDPSGTEFQQLVWKLLLEISYGKTRTYGEIARDAARILGREKMSAQAVGQAVGRNPIAILIPCHRVLGVGGRLTGYAYGLEKKVWLLNHEQKEEKQ